MLEVWRSGLHAWLGRPTSAREIHDAKLVTAIDASFKASDRTSGARRVWRDVLEEGLACGLSPDRTADTAQCLEGAAQAPWKAQGRWRTVCHCRQHPGPELPGRSAEPEVAGRFCFADLRFTYIWTAAGWLYVAVVPDLFSRRVVG